MNKLILIIILLCVSQVFSQTDELFFKADSGKRVVYGAMGGIYFNDSGTVYLYGVNGPNQSLYISQNGLDFDSVNINDYPDYRALKLPDSTYVKFNVELQDSVAVLKSSTSPDGRVFTQNNNILFTFPKNDAITHSGAYHTNFFNAEGGICFVYLAGDLDNARSIYSPPGSPNMTFGDYRTNIFGDSTFGGGSYSFWDPNGILLPDGRLRIIVMAQHGPPAPPAERKGTLYTFTSTDNGETWVQDPDYRLRYDSFTEFDVYSLNDPKLVRLPDGRFRIYVAAMIKGSDGSYKYSILSATSQESPNDVAESERYGNTFRLLQNYPNPFNPSTVIEYSIPAETGYIPSVHLKIYDVLGREVATLVNKRQNPGNYKINFDAENFSSGIYFYQLSTGNFSETKKMILLR